MKHSFLPCSVYGFALSALIFSHYVTNAVLALFVATPYTLGTHGELWQNWHGVGCFFLGLVNLAAHRWREPRPRRDVAGATAVIYGVWALQNFALMFTPRMVPLMWLNVIGCALASAASLATLRSLNGAAREVA